MTLLIQMQDNGNKGRVFSDAAVHQGAALLLSADDSGRGHSADEGASREDLDWSLEGVQVEEDDVGPLEDSGGGKIDKKCEYRGRFFKKCGGQPNETVSTVTCSFDRSNFVNCRFI